jgi:hypothetical protein
MADPVSKISMDPNFERRLRDLRDHAAEQSDAVVTGEQRTYFTPAGWNGDPLDVEGLSAPFTRTQANQQMIEAMANQNEPGTTGDVVAASVMVNELAIMERAFRARHTLRRCRATAHAQARLQGHGSDTGPLMQLGVEYVRSIIQQAKKPNT